ncbi:MAG: efflux RND transporter permease subunit [Ignavibacteriales bacterium]|nr:efflux RND transporter permease subunit [Ignavibacteriales bacterium]
MRITNISIENRTSVFILFFIIIIGGALAYISLPRESTPDIQIPLVIVSTPYFGVSPEDIESLITQPIEKELNTISDIKEISSSSFEGYSIIRAEFESGFDIDEAVQKVRDKVTKAESELPDDCEKPAIMEINFSEWPIFTFSLSGPQGLVKLKDIADDLKDEIEKVDGVLEVKISGGLEREVKVNVDINKLIHYNVRFSDIIGAISEENKTIPGGLIDLDDMSFLVRIPGEFDKPYLIEDLIIKIKDGTPIYVKDVAEVEYSFKDRNTYSRLNGNDCVTLSVSKRSGANIIYIVEDVQEIIRKAENKLPDSIEFTTIVNYAKDIKQNVNNLENNIFSGLVLVLLVLLFFLGIRNSSFVGMAIPLSMLISFIVLSAMNITLNFIVLFCLIFALGMLVDNAIVIVENIYKFLEEGYSLKEAAKKGAAEVAWPITTSTLTTVMAFAPLLFWEGVVGDFMWFLPITVIITLSASLFVALVINPVFASKFMRLEEKGKKPHTIFGKILYPIDKVTHYFIDNFIPHIINAYEKFLRKIVGTGRTHTDKISKRTWYGLGAIFLLMVFFFYGLSHPEIPNFLVIILTIILGVALQFIFQNNKLRVLSATFLLLIVITNTYFQFNLGIEFFPETDPPRISLNVEAPTGTNIEMTNRITKKIEERLQKYTNGDVKHIVANVGSSSNIFDGGTFTPNKSTLTVEYIDYNDREQSSLITTEQIRDELTSISGAEIEISKETMGPPVGQPINVEIIGDNLKKLGELTEQIKNEIKDIPGVVDLKDNFDAGKPEVRVLINRERAALYSMNTSLIANYIRTAINGFTASKYRIDEEEYDITVRLQKLQRDNIDALKNMRITYNDKQGKSLSVPLSSVAEVVYDKGPGAIRRTDLKRVITISGNVDEGFNQNEVLENVKQKLSTFQLPNEYYINFGGQNEFQEDAQKFLGKAFMIAIFGIFLILVIQFNSLFQPLLIMIAVLISLIGVFLGLTITQLTFGIIMTGIGVISLAGVIVNNNIVLIDYINILQKRGINPHEAAIQAGIRRFRPVILTAITTVLGLVPLTMGWGFDVKSFAFVGGGEEADFWRSLGVSVIFGLSFGTILTLIIVPVIYSTVNDLKVIVKSKFGRKKELPIDNL